MSGLKVNWKDFNPSNLIELSPTTHKTKDKVTGQEIVYYDIPLHYRYTILNPAVPMIADLTDPEPDNNKKRKIQDPNYFVLHPDAKPTIQVVQELNIELPRVRSPRGLMKSTKNSGGYTKWQYWVLFQLANEETRKFLARDDLGDEVELGFPNGACHLLYQVMIAMVFKHKGAIGQAERREERDIRSICEYPVYWPRDKITGKVIKDKDPSQFFGLFNYENSGSRTPIMLANGKVLDWELCQNAETEFIPLWNIKAIRLATGKARLFGQLHSCVVTDIKPASAESGQMDTIEGFAGDAALQSKLDEQLAALKVAFVASKADAIKKKEEAAAAQPAAAALPALPTANAAILPALPSAGQPQQYQQPATISPPALPPQYQQPQQQYQQPAAQSYPQQGYQPQQYQQPQQQYQQPAAQSYPQQGYQQQQYPPQTPLMQPQTMPTNPLSAVLSAAPTMSTGMPSMSAMPVLP